jgi:hypothetical protein
MMVSVKTLGNFQVIREKESLGTTALTYSDDKASSNKQIITELVGTVEML